MLLKSATETRLRAEEHVGQETSPYAGGRAPQFIYLSCTQTYSFFFFSSQLLIPAS